MFFFFEVRPLILESRREKWREFEVEAEAEAEAGTAFSPPLVQERSLHASRLFLLVYESNGTLPQKSCQT